MKANYHPDILKLETIKIDVSLSQGAGSTKYSGRGEEFYIVPTEMIIKRNEEYDLWKGCPLLVNFDILDCIKALEKNEKFPYNSTVGQMFCDKYNLGKYLEHSFLSAMVYCTQSYNSSVEDEENARALDIKLKENGFIKATKEILSDAVETRKKFFVMLKSQNFMGYEGLTKKEKPLILKEWGEMGLHWMAANATRSGYRAYEGQYIKPFKN